MGDPRTNQNPAILAIGIVFFRYHNVIANKIQQKHPSWSDEEIFQRARRFVIATLQVLVFIIVITCFSGNAQIICCIELNLKAELLIIFKMPFLYNFLKNIIMYEYIPAFLGEPVGEYGGYKPDVHPGVSHLFQSAAFRFGHTMIPPGLYRRDGQCNFKSAPTGTPAIRLCSAWWDAAEILVNNSVEEFILGMASQLAEREDSLLCSDVRNKLFGPMEFSRRDLGALNIMRGRDTGLPDYNTARKSFRLSPITNWTDINPALALKNPEWFPKLAELYDGDVNNVDVYIGGMLESTNGPGPLFSAIIKEQFARIRDSDRFWFENTDNNIFTQSEIEEIRKITFYDVIRSTLNITEGEIQKSVFFFHEGDPCPQPAQLNASTLTPCNFLAGYDYFSGSEVPYTTVAFYWPSFPLFVLALDMES